jgi:hypothetical protein
MIFATLALVSCNKKAAKENNAEKMDFIIDRELSLNDYSKYNGVKPEGGVVPNDTIAFQIAEIVLSHIYGEEVIENEKPFSVNLENGVWIIEGSFSEEYDKGGSAYIEINKQTGEIIKVFHTK